MRRLGTRHARAVEPATSGAYGEGPECEMGVTFGVSIVRTACSRCTLRASGKHPRPPPSLDHRKPRVVRLRLRGRAAGGREHPA